MRKGDKLTDKPIARFDFFQMIKRRAKAASPLFHVLSYLATGITTYLQIGGTLERAQTIATTSRPERPSFMTAPVRSFRRKRSKESKSKVLL